MQKLMKVTAWLNEDPQRVRVISMAVAGVLAVVALLVPEVAALADPIAGSGSG